MRIVGYSCQQPDPPLSTAHVGLAPLTVVLGANDSGKSSLLRAVGRDLAGGDFGGLSRECHRVFGGVFFAVASDAELAALVREGADIRKERREAPSWFYGVRPPWVNDVERSLPFSGDERGTDADVIAAAVRTVAARHQSEGFDAVVAALEQSRLLGLEPAGVSDGSRIWNVYWCLHREAEGNADVKRGLDLSNLVYRAKRPQGGRSSGGGINIGRNYFAHEYGNPSHLFVDDGPIVVCPIGQSVRLRLPTSLSVPTEFERLRQEVVDAINQIVVASRFGLQDAGRDGPFTDADRREQQTPLSWLMQLDGGTLGLHPDAVAAARFVSASANRLLPTFAACRYQLEVALTSVRELACGHPNVVELQLRSRNAGGQTVFSVEDAAQGLRLWLQLALLQACEQAGRVAAAITTAYYGMAERGEQMDHAFSSGDDDAGDALAAEVEAFERSASAMVEDLHALDPMSQPWVSGELAVTLSSPDPDNWMHPNARHRRFFIIDEPEQHLHPALQREAAAWLQELSNQRGACSLVATHSVPFLNLPPNPGSLMYLFVRREADSAAFSEIDPTSLGLLDDREIVTTMGFDRGELFTLVRLFLIVEGAHDAVILNAVFEELRHAHIAVLPLGGTAAHQALLDSDALWRYTTANVALMTDKFDEELVRRIVEDPKYAKRIRRNDSGASQEPKDLSKLVLNAQATDKHRQIYLLGHRGADLLDVLDEDIVQQEFPAYPGHATADALWQEAVEGGRKSSQRKAFYEEQFKIPADINTYRKLGETLAAAGRKPPALKTIVDQAISIASGTPPSGTITTRSPELELPDGNAIGPDSSTPAVSASDTPAPDPSEPLPPES